MTPTSSTAALRGTSAIPQAGPTSAYALRPGAGTALAAELPGTHDPAATLNAAATDDRDGMPAGLVLVAMHELDIRDQAYRDVLAADRTRSTDVRDTSVAPVLAERCAAATAWLARLIAAHLGTRAGT